MDISKYKIEKAFQREFGTHCYCKINMGSNEACNQGPYGRVHVAHLSNTSAHDDLRYRPIRYCVTNRQEE